MRRNLIVYYSYSGNTRSVAKKIHQVVGGDLVEIIPLQPYPDKYQQVLRRSKEEIRSNYLPQIMLSMDSIEGYDTIYVGSPNWWNSVAPPVLAFLEKFDFQGKTICPFCTHGGGGSGHMWGDIEKVTKNAAHNGGLALFGTGSSHVEDAIVDWIRV